MSFALRIAATNYGGRGVAITALVSVPGHLLFWGAQRMRIVIHRDRLTIVRPLSTVEVDRSVIQSADVGPGLLWGEMIVLKTADGIVGVPMFQAGRGRRDTWTHEDMVYALNHIRYWLDHGEPYLGPEARDVG